MISHRLPVDECPCCGYPRSAVSGTDHDETPAIGDVTICFKCGAICEFNSEMKQVLVPEANLLAPVYAEAVKTRAVVRRFQGIGVRA